MIHSQAQGRGPVPVIWLLLFLPIISDEVINIIVGIFIGLASICTMYDDSDSPLRSHAAQTAACPWQHRMQEGRPMLRQKHSMPSWAGGDHSVQQSCAGVFKWLKLTL